MRKVKKSDVIVMIVLMLLSMVLMNRLAQLYILSNCGQNIANGVMFALDNFFHFTEYGFKVAFSSNVMLPCFIAALGVFLAFMYYFSTKKNFMYGKEHGSARWGTAKDIADRKSVV